MNDFIQSLSFHGPASPVTAPRGLDPVRFIMRSFDEVPFTAFRPSHAPRVSRSRKGRKPAAAQPVPRA